MLSRLSPVLKQRISPWVEWASAEPMRHKITKALQLLDGDDDATVHRNDLTRHAQSRRHQARMHSRDMRELFAEFGSKDAEHKNERHAHIKKILEKLKPDELADVIAELPVFMAKQHKPLPLRILGDKNVASMATEMLNHYLTIAQGPNVAPDVMQGLLAIMGTAVIGKAPARG